MSNYEKRIFTSKPFRFIIEGKIFFIHSALVASHSVPLSRLIDKELLEGKQGFVFLKDVDEGTFARYCKWAYTYDYNAAPAVIAESDIPLYHPSIEDPEASDSKMSSGNIAGGKNTLKQGRRKKSRFEDRPPPSDVKGVSETGSLEETFYDYTEHILSHARTYVFATEYDIEALKTLAVTKLEDCLAGHTLFPDRIKAIVALLKYIYANTKRWKDGWESMRRMLNTYMIQEIDYLMSDDEFRNLLKKQGCLIANFRPR